MLAHFSLLSASWVHFSRLAAFVAPFGRFFRDLGRSSLDFEAQVGYMLVGLATFFLVFLHDLRDGTNALKPRKNCVLPPTSANSMVLAFASKNNKKSL